MLTNKRTTYILLDKTAGEDLALLKEIEALKIEALKKLYPQLNELRYLLNDELFEE